MIRIVCLCAAYCLGQDAPTQSVIELLRQSPEAEFLAQPVVQSALDQSHRLPEVTLDLAADPVPPTLEASTEAENLSGDPEPVGLVLGPEDLWPLVPEGSSEEAVRGMLAVLVKEKLRRFRVDVVFVPPRSLDASPAFTAELESGLDAAQLEAVVERAGDTALRVTLTSSNEQTVQVSTARRRATHWVDQINQTGVIPVADVAIESLPLGFTAQVQPHTVGSSGFAELKLRVWRTAETGKVAKREGPYSQNEVVSLEERSLETRLFVPLGKAVVAGSFDDASDGGNDRSFAVLARVEALGDFDLAPGGRKLLAADGLELRAFDVGFLRRVLKRQEMEQPLEDRLREEVEPEAWREPGTGVSLSGSFLYAAAPPSVQSAVAAWLESRQRVALHGVTFETRVLEGSLERLIALRQKAERGAFLEPQALEGEAGAGLDATYRSVLRSIPGDRTRFRAVQARSYVRDLSLVSGGMGFALVEMPAEIVQLGGSGFEGAFTAEESALPGSLLVRTEWLRARTRFERQAPHRVYPLSTLQMGAAGDPSQGLSLKPVGSAALAEPIIFPIDLPEGDALRSSLLAVLPTDRWTVLKLESSSPGRGRMLAARMRVATPGGAVAASSPAQPLTPGSLVALPESGPLQLPTLRNGAALVLGFDHLGGNEPVSFTGGLPGPRAEREALEQELREANAAIDPLELGRRIEAHESRCFTVEAAFVSPTAIPPSPPGSSPWLPEDLFEKACIESNPPAEVVAASSPAGGRLRLCPRGTRVQIADQEVSQTGFVPVVSPAVARLPDGAFVEATVHELPDESLLRVDLRVDLHHLDPKIERRWLPDGDIELAAGSSRVFAASILAPPGRTVAAGSVRLPGATGSDGFLLLVRVTPWRLGNDPGVPAQARVACIDLGAMTEPLPQPSTWDREWAFHRRGWSDAVVDLGDLRPGPVATADLDKVCERIESVPDAKWVADGRSVLIAAEAGVAREARESLAALSRRALRPYVVDLWQGSVEPAALDSLTGGAAPAKEWLDRMGREGLRVRALVTSGARASIASFDARACVSGVNRISGGTGFSIIEVGEVEIQTASEGLTLDLYVRPIAGTDTVQIGLLGELARKPKLERSTLASNPRLSVGASGPKQPKPDSVPAGFQIDLPDEDSDRLHHSGPVPLGRPVLLQALPDPSDPRRVRPIVAVVTEVKLE